MRSFVFVFALLAAMSCRDAPLDAERETLLRRHASIIDEERADMADCGRDLALRNGCRTRSLARRIRADEIADRLGDIARIQSPRDDREPETFPGEKETMLATRTPIATRSGGQVWDGVCVECHDEIKLLIPTFSEEKTITTADGRRLKIDDAFLRRKLQDEKSLARGDREPFDHASLRLTAEQVDYIADLMR